MRSRILHSFLLAFFICLLPACSRKEQPRIVLYSSVDPGVLKTILESYTARTGVKIDLVTDTEATKTTGLVNRLIAEKAAPRADVWWSGEVVGSVQLARAGVLAPYASPGAARAAASSGAPAWPLHAGNDAWHGLALRPRVIVYSTRAHPDSDAAPRTLADLASSKKPVAIANPAFGTTRGHLAALYNATGREPFIGLMSSVNWRVVDGNAAVVRAVADGACDAGLTDYDDYRAGLANGWPLACAFPPLSAAEPGCVATPGTIALVAGAPHPEQAKAFIDATLAPITEQTLAAGPWASIPALKSIELPADPQRTKDGLNAVAAATIDWEKAAEALEQAAAAWAESQKKR